MSTAEEVKRRIRRSSKLFHDSTYWSLEDAAEFESDAPKGMSLLEWIDEAINSLGQRETRMKEFLLNAAGPSFTRLELHKEANMLLGEFAAEDS